MVTRQVCPLDIGSFGHTSEEVEYAWATRPLVLLQQVSLAQHVLGNWSHGTGSVTLKTGRRSIISLNFQFHRTLGFYMLQLYIPLTIIVMSSWVSFWLVRTEVGRETPARTGLGGSCTLAVVTVGLGGKTKPQVGYATAMDIFIIICFVSVFCTLIEFAFINFVDVFIRRLKMKDIERSVILKERTHSMAAPVVDTSIFRLELPAGRPGLAWQTSSPGESVGLRPPRHPRRQRTPAGSGPTWRCRPSSPQWSVSSQPGDLT
jgi:hypothetical protein